MILFWTENVFIHVREWISPNVHVPEDGMMEGEMEVFVIVAQELWSIVMIMIIIMMIALLILHIIATE